MRRATIARISGFITFMVLFVPVSMFVRALNNYDGEQNFFGITFKKGIEDDSRWFIFDELFLVVVLILFGGMFAFWASDQVSKYIKRKGTVPMKYRLNYFKNKNLKSPELDFHIEQNHLAYIFAYLDEKGYIWTDGKILKVTDRQKNPDMGPVEYYERDTD